MEIIILKRNYSKIILKLQTTNRCEKLLICRLFGFYVLERVGKEECVHVSDGCGGWGKDKRVSCLSCKTSEYLHFVRRVMFWNNENLSHPGKLSNCLNLQKIPSYSSIYLKHEVSFPPTTAYSLVQMARNTTLLEGPLTVLIKMLEKKTLKYI